MKAPKPTENASCGVLRRASAVAQGRSRQPMVCLTKPTLRVRVGEGWGGQTAEELGGALRSKQIQVDLIGHVLMHVTAVHEMPVHQPG